jgi:hypothetical protein
MPSSLQVSGQHCGPIVRKAFFLIDTGAPFSIVPFKCTLKPLGQRLAGPDSQSIPCWSEGKTDLIFKGRRFTWICLLADVQFPIISVDFLRHFRPLVDTSTAHNPSPSSRRLQPQRLCRRSGTCCSAFERWSTQIKGYTISHQVQGREHHIRVKDELPSAHFC